MSDKWEQLERLAKEATPGPWNAGGEIECHCGESRDCWHEFSKQAFVLPAGDYSGPVTTASHTEYKNGPFIAAANPSTILSLLSDYRSALARNGELEAKLAAVPDAGLEEAARLLEIAKDADLYTDEWKAVCDWLSRYEATKQATGKATE